jgi:ABC-type transport system involved in multi-copper enzyme maturation permease subunit
VIPLNVVTLKIISSSIALILIVGFVFLIIVGAMFGTSLNQQLKEVCLQQEVPQRLSEDCTDVF